MAHNFTPVKFFQRIQKHFLRLCKVCWLKIPNTPFQYQVHQPNTKCTNQNTKYSSILISAVCRRSIFVNLYNFWRSISKPRCWHMKNDKYHVCPQMLIFSKSDCPSRAANGPSWLSPVLSGQVPGRSPADVSLVSHCPQQAIPIYNNTNIIPI